MFPLTRSDTHVHPFHNSLGNGWYLQEKRMKISESSKYFDLLPNVHLDRDSQVKQISESINR